MRPILNDQYLDNLEIMVFGLSSIYEIYKMEFV